MAFNPDSTATRPNKIHQKRVPDSHTYAKPAGSAAPRHINDIFSRLSHMTIGGSSNVPSTAGTHLGSPSSPLVRRRIALFVGHRTNVPQADQVAVGIGEFGAIAPEVLLRPVIEVHAAGRPGGVRGIDVVDLEPQRDAVRD